MAQPANIVTREEIEALLQRPITKGLLAECFGVTTQQFAQTRINLPAGKSMGEWMRIIYKRRSEAAAGRSDSLVEERARLAREQADRVAMENAAKRGDLAPVGVIEMMLAAIAAQAVASLEAVPGRVRMRLPHLTAADISAIEREIAAARNTIAGAAVKVPKERRGRAV
jgi:phage terminase Nu1 subunit (DNA packaging protein)